MQHSRCIFALIWTHYW